MELNFALMENFKKLLSMICSPAIQTFNRLSTSQWRSLNLQEEEDFGFSSWRKLGQKSMGAMKTLLVVTTRMLSDA
jgi:hypothetical protein